MSIEIGKKAPDFEAPATGDKNLKFSDLRGKKIVLYFYPKDNTPGCISEGQDFRDLRAEFTRLNTIILGVSRDSIKTHENFRAKHDFGFDLLSDKDENLCAMFDVLKPKKLYGREYVGIERSTFLFDEQGVLRHEWRKVKVKGHADDVLAAIKKI